MTLAREMGMKVTRRRIRVEELADMQEGRNLQTELLKPKSDELWLSLR